MYDEAQPLRSIRSENAHVESNTSRTVVNSINGTVIDVDCGMLSHTYGLK